jgi:hypothetical protein
MEVEVEIHIFFARDDVFVNGSPRDETTTSVFFARDDVFINGSPRDRSAKNVEDD